ncbi:DUF2846 domain-containing protein [Methyloterricola oryzae]|uniref:DUF2846 domain-containing protein n=1 Tax=Methyloterricola oryzae TaxID=1495050 RepID=UPI0005EAF066|nr:DUF2846 domain-containing protein [Methyloterricola oryzae]
MPHRTPQGRGIAWVLLAAVTSGCSTAAPHFKPAEAIPPGKGVVYIYRQPRIAGSGVVGTITANKVAIVRIRSGGYFPYISEPGRVNFAVKSEVTDEADVNVEAGKATYLKVSIGSGFRMSQFNLSEVPLELGSLEITECRLLPPIEP